MKILFLIADLDPGGAERYVVKLANVLQDRGHQITIVTIVQPGLFVNEIGDSVKFYDLSIPNYKNPFGMLRAVMRLRCILNEGLYDVIHTNKYLADFVGAFTSVGLRLRLVTTIHGPGRLLKPRVYDLSLRMADKVLCASREIHEKCSRIVGDDKAFYLPNFVDICEFNDAFREIGEKAFINFGTVGRLFPSKNFEFSLRLFAKLKSKKSYVNMFFIIGDGPQSEHLRNVSKRLKVEQFVEFTGWLSHNELRKKLKEVDLFVFPSLKEGLPIAVLEAMAAGKVVFTNAIGDLKSLIVNGYNGFLINPNDLEQSYRIISQFLNLLKKTPEYIKIIQNNARKTLEENYSLKTYIRNLLEVYKRNI